jgi:hypothetical protein
MGATPNGQEGPREDLESQIRELWTGKEGVIEELQWLQDTLDGKSKKDAKGKEKEKEKESGTKHKINFDMSIKNVLDILGSKPKKDLDEKQLASHGRLRNTITKILKCIETLGGMVAGAASTVCTDLLTIHVLGKILT